MGVVKAKIAKVSVEEEIIPTIAPVKRNALNALIRDLEKKHGMNSVRIGYGLANVEQDFSSVIERIPTGSISLDIDLGGGIPVGRFVEISGALSSTKTTQCLHILRNAQKMGLVCAFFDAEGTTEEEYMKRIGIDVDALIYSRPDGLEEVTQLILDLQKSGLVHLALWDSIEASPPTKEFESAMDETIQMGGKPKLLGEFFRKYQAHNNRLVREGKRPFTLLAINQLREKIGSYGDPEYTPGGRAKGFAASVDIRFRRGDWIREGTGDNAEMVGQIVKYKIEKNKTYKRMRTGEFDFYFTKDNALGIPEGFNDNASEVIACAVEWNLIEKSGSWFSYGEAKFQGLDKLIAYLRTNEDVVQELRTKLLEVSNRVGGSDAV